MIDYGEDFNEPDYIKIDIKEYQKMKEELECYKTAIEMIEEINYQGEIYKIISDLKKEI